MCKFGLHKWILAEIYTQPLSKPLKSGKEMISHIEYQHYKCKTCNKKKIKESRNLFYLTMKQKNNKEANEKDA